MTAENGDRLPPHDESAEREVLGGMIRNNGIIDEVSAMLSADSFWSIAHQRIYRAIMHLREPGGKSVTLPQVIGELERRGHLEGIGRDGIGGKSYLFDLWDQSPTGCNAPYHAKLVRDAAHCRSLIRVATDIFQNAYDHNQPADEMQAQAERAILALGESGSEGQSYDAATIVKETLLRMNEREKRGSKLAGFSTGFVALDHFTAGLQPSELIVLAARPGIGKTSLGLAIAAHAFLKESVPVFFVSLEQSRTELMERLFCSTAQVDGHDMRRSNLEDAEMDSVIEASDRIAAGSFFVSDDNYQTITRIAANTRRHHRQHGIGLLVVDYLQLIEPENRRDPRHEQVGQISRRLKGLARELRIPVLALAQLNREIENRKCQRPRLSDLRESGSIEADADTVILMHKPVADNDPDRLELLIAKQRNGPTGEVALTFRRNQMRFEEMHATPFSDAGSV
ncbi:MAG TPA: replicative DNA helicase [Gemmataceae bacterium]|jgi:replicative DNA helicase